MSRVEMKNELKREEMIFSPLLLSCRTLSLSNASAAFALLNDKFSKLRAAHYRPNVPDEGAINLDATSPQVGGMLSGLRPGGQPQRRIYGRKN